MSSWWRTIPRASTKYRVVDAWLRTLVLWMSLVLLMCKRRRLTRPHACSTEFWLKVRWLRSINGLSSTNLIRARRVAISQLWTSTLTSRSALTKVIWVSQPSSTSPNLISQWFKSSRTIRISLTMTLRFPSLKLRLKASSSLSGNSKLGAISWTIATITKSWKTCKAWMTNCVKSATMQSRSSSRSPTSYTRRTALTTWTTRCCWCASTNSTKKTIRWRRKTTTSSKWAQKTTSSWCWSLSAAAKFAKARAASSAETTVAWKTQFDQFLFSFSLFFIKNYHF